MDSGRDLDLRRDTVQGDVRARPVPRLEDNEVFFGRPPRHVVQSGRPEVQLALEVIDTDDDGANPDHVAKLHRAAARNTRRASGRISPDSSGRRSRVVQFAVEYKEP